MFARDAAGRCTGAVEVWGRGASRVIEECLRAGIEPPLFEVDADFVAVTFRAQIGPTAQGTAQVAAQPTAQVGIKFSHLISRQGSSR